MKTKKNAVVKVVEWSDADKCYVGSALPLIGPCCHGDNEAEVYKQLCEIVEEWQKDGARDLNPRGKASKLSADKKFSGRFMLRIDPRLHKALAIKAARQGKSLNAFVAEKLGR
jgi:predicted HicB family RNase H-like nuclease